MRPCSRAHALFATCALLLSFLLGACSAIRTVYNQADHVLAWRADDYFDLTEEQRHMLRTRFQQLHAWHRATQLPGYASLLEVADRRLHEGLDEPDIRWAWSEIRSQFRTSLLHAHSEVAAFLATLSESQIAHARRRFESENRRFAREHGLNASAQEQRRLRAKRWLEGIEHWAGPLDSEQQARITALSATLPLDAAFRMEDRLRRQRDFLALLAGRKMLSVA